MRPPRRAVALWTALVAASVAALLVARVHPAWFLFAALLIAPVLAPWTRARLFDRPARVRAVGRIEWDGGSSWRLTDAGGANQPGRLVGTTATLGPWLLLAWSVGATGTRRYALVEVWDVASTAFRALNGRLALLCGPAGGSRRAL